MRPDVIVLDVNETVSDLAPMNDRFVEVGLPGHLAATWFAGVLRDGMALTVAGQSATFAAVGADVLRPMLPDGADADHAVQHVLTGFTTLDVHPDVPDGLRAISAAGIASATLSNGSASIAKGLLERAGLDDVVTHVLSVEDVGIWKPAPAAYRYALGELDVAADRAMLVSVHPWDLDGAHRAGLATAWINRTGVTYPGHFSRPDVEVASFVELAETLGR